MPRSKFSESGRFIAVFALILVSSLSLTSCGGDGAWSDDTPPSTPTGLIATAVSSTQIDLSWNPSSDDNDVWGYWIYRDGIYLKFVPTTSSSDTGLSPDTTYIYTVSAKDNAFNESGQSNPATATTSPPYKVIVSGTVFPPEGISPSSLEIVSLGTSYPVNSNGNFHAMVNAEGVAAVIGVIPEKDLGLMNIVLTKHNVPNSPMEINFQTTAAGMVFLSPLLFTTDTAQAETLLAVIKENNFVTGPLAQSIQEAISSGNPQDEQTLRNNLNLAVSDVIRNLQSTSSEINSRD